MKGIKSALIIMTIKNTKITGDKIGEEETKEKIFLKNP